MAVMVNGVAIAYTAAGPEDGPVAVLVHGGGATRGTWDGFFGELAGTHRVYAIDVRRSSETGRYDLIALRDDVLGFLDAVGVARAALIGHSSGGTIALLAAAHRPERVTRLVLEEAALPKPGALRLGPLSTPDLARETVIAQLNAPDPAWWAALPAITAPTLLLTGGPAGHLPPALPHEAAALIPDARVLEIPVGHHIHRDAPDAFRDAVLTFLAD